MDLAKLKEMMDLLEGSDLHKLSIREKNGIEIHLEKTPMAPAAPVVHQVASHPSEQIKPSTHVATGKGQEEEKPGDYITSPMVGTHYGSPSPQEGPFVKVGDNVTPDTVVCIIEAMKVMNEVKAGKAGIIREILIENAHPVEFGTKLIRIE